MHMKSRSEVYFMILYTSDKYLAPLFLPYSRMKELSRIMQFGIMHSPQVVNSEISCSAKSSWLRIRPIFVQLSTQSSVLVLFDAMPTVGKMQSNGSMRVQKSLIVIFIVIFWKICAYRRRNCIVIASRRHLLMCCFFLIFIFHDLLPAAVFVFTLSSLHSSSTSFHFYLEPTLTPHYSSIGVLATSSSKRMYIMSLR